MLEKLGSGKRNMCGNIMMSLTDSKVGLHGHGKGHSIGSLLKMGMHRVRQGFCRFVLEFGSGVV